MNLFYKSSLTAVFIIAAYTAFSQQTVRGKILDAITRSAIANASITVKAAGSNISGAGSTTNAFGVFSIKIAPGDQLIVSSVNYQTTTLRPTSDNLIISLSPQDNRLQEMIVSGNRTVQKRTEAPIAISTITTQTIAETKANQIDQLLNKVSGVFMVDL
ncbi:MAG: carboxypeptidase-like regulatory domain-containing protein, partial [Chitinophaga rupis]